MSSRTFLCGKCGALRRASAIYRQHKETLAQSQTSLRWPKHCGEAMQVLSYEQGVAANKLNNQERIGWAGKGLFIIQRCGKRKWVPALNPRQIDEAKQQYAAFLNDRRQGSRTKIY